ncbi:hypothetical protein M8J76_009820 [Diaphorina citri]|nr:hypothetical protein M8J75_008984 [Diaphorina citri]KAI5737073.1 hypothetical protein M8J76_009820 [Diaphorina citri]
MISSSPILQVVGLFGSYQIRLAQIQLSVKSVILGKTTRGAFGHQSFCGRHFYISSVFGFRSKLFHSPGSKTSSKASPWDRSLFTAHVLAIQCIPEAYTKDPETQV